VHHAGAPSLDHLKRSPLLDRTTLEANWRSSSVRPPPAAWHRSPFLKTRMQRRMPCSRRWLRRRASCCSSIPTPMRKLRFDERTRALSAMRATRACSSIWTRPLLEPAGPCGLHSGQLVFRHHGGCLLRAAGGECGMRQQGRERARNIIDAPAETAAIQAALHKRVAAGVSRVFARHDQPYGNGAASKTIAYILTVFA